MSALENKPPEMAYKVLKWLAIRVIFGSSPILIGAMLLYVSDQSVTLEKLIGKGELFMLTVGIGAGAVAEVIGTGKTVREWKLLAILGTFLCMVSSSALFAGMHHATGSANLFAPDKVVVLSMFLYLSNFFCSLGCVFMSELKD